MPVKYIDRRITLVVIIAMPVALLLLMSYCAVCYDSNSSFFAFMNRITSYRPHFAHEYYLKVRPISLLGHPYEMLPYYHNGVPFQSLDSGYCFMVFVFGLGALGALFITYLYAVPTIVRSESDLGYVLLIVASSLYLVIEGFPLYITTSPVMLLLSAAFQPRDAASDG